MGVHDKSACKSLLRAPCILKVTEFICLIDYVVVMVRLGKDGVDRGIRLHSTGVSGVRVNLRSAAIGLCTACSVSLQEDLTKQHLGRRMQVRSAGLPAIFHDLDWGHLEGADQVSCEQASCCHSYFHLLIID